jgi:delta 1-pyrroline-5-carboxylate dehydrogenase
VGAAEEWFAPVNLPILGWISLRPLGGLPISKPQGKGSSMNFDHNYTMTGGKAVDATQEEPVINPATEEVFAQMPSASRQQLDSAVASAKAAFPAWSGRPFAERKKFVSQIGRSSRSIRRP